MRRGYGHRINAYAVFAIVALTLLGLGIAAILGVTQATSSQTYASDEADTVMLETSESPDEEVAEPADEESLGDEADTESTPDPSLQKIRDTYLSMTYAFSDVMIRYDVDHACKSSQACIGAEGQEILVDEAWAQHADADQRTLTLAQVHADLAVRKIWDTSQQAQEALSGIIPECTVDGDKLLAEVAPSDESDAAPVPAPSVTAMKDVVVSLMVTTDQPNATYTPDQFTSEQIIAAEHIAQGKAPEVVMAVESPHCLDR
ncbi:hypothetical protein [Jonesia quinghaiensis]|uniref:hypothetical protein n=1 Tax=Jonesia quinghaiensis TaxID=262806 RepID=UPI00048EFB66|nr:hypothetical protein [Jonesia quinghaiensis]